MSLTPTLDVRQTPLYPYAGNQNVLLGSAQVSVVADQVFGADEWKTYFGLDVKEVPLLPDNIKQILEQECPINIGKRVGETHLLILIPKGLKLPDLARLAENPLIGNPLAIVKTCITYKVKDGSWCQTANYPSIGPCPDTHWLLITKDVVLDSLNKKFEDQKQIALTYIEKGYCFKYGNLDWKHKSSKCVYVNLTNAIDVCASIVAAHVRTGVRLYSGYSTRCVDDRLGDVWCVGIDDTGLRVEMDGEWDAKDLVGVNLSTEFWQ